jgi:hypothetical protein
LLSLLALLGAPVTVSAAVQDLVEVACGNSQASRRTRAVEMLEGHEEALAAVACQADFATTRLDAAGRLQEADSRCAVLESNRCGTDVRWRLLGDCRDPEVLGRVALQTDTPHLAVAAAKRLAGLGSTDQLVAAAKVSPLTAIHEAALVHMNEEDRAELVLREGVDATVRLRALGLGISEASLVKVVLTTDPGAELAQRAVDQLQSERSLLRILAASPVQWRPVLLGRLSDEGLLAARDLGGEVGTAAVKLFVGRVWVRSWRGLLAFALGFITITAIVAAVWRKIRLDRRRRFHWRDYREVFQAVVSGDMELLQRVPARCLTERGPKGLTLAHVAAAIGDPVSLRIIGERVPKVLTMRDRRGRQPLAVAIERGRLLAAGVISELVTGGTSSATLATASSRPATTTRKAHREDRP